MKLKTIVCCREYEEMCGGILLFTMARRWEGCYWNLVMESGIINVLMTDVVMLFYPQCQRCLC